ncbi:MAG: protoporphyrinogen/coproporphyrinogen oxidase [Phycisphaerales bacterium]
MGLNDAHSPRLLILGAGPTGLGAGYRLHELGHRNFSIYERSPHVGGLASSFTDSAGFTWDIGGHVLFSHYRYYDELFDRLMRGEFTLNNRESWVRILDRWVPYPFQNNIRYLPREAALECILGLVRAQSASGGPARAIADAANFGELNRALFGEGIDRLFMRPYNFKVWAHPPEMLSKAWIGERVAVIDMERALRNLVLERDDFGWGPNNQFRFPHRGTGDFYQRFVPVLSEHLRLGVGIVAIDPATRTVRLSDGTTDRYDLMLSTMPLDLLCRDVVGGSAGEGDGRGGGVPTDVRDAATGLKHSSGHMVGIGLELPCPSTRSWMYFPEDNCPFYRVTYLSNYSPFMTPDPKRFYSLLCETSRSVYKPEDAATIVERTIAGLVAAGLITRDDTRRIVTKWHYFADYSYPTPTVDRDERLAAALPWLESRGIASRGRFGLWKYEVSNTDHAVMQGVEWANRVLLGEPEETMGVRYEIADHGRGKATIYRPAAAGSGQPRTPTPGKPMPAIAEPKPVVAEPKPTVPRFTEPNPGAPKRPIG